MFYAAHLDEVALVVEGFDRDEAKCSREVQELLQKPSLKGDLAFIQSHLGFLPAAIEQLEEAGLPLNCSLEIVSNAEIRINSIPGPRGDTFKTKLAQVLKKNVGLQVLKKANSVLQGETGAEIP